MGGLLFFTTLKGSMVLYFRVVNILRLLYSKYLIKGKKYFDFRQLYPYCILFLMFIFDSFYPKLPLIKKYEIKFSNELDIIFNYFIFISGVCIR